MKKSKKGKKQKLEKTIKKQEVSKEIKKLTKQGHKTFARYIQKARITIKEAMRLGRIFNELKPKIKKEKKQNWEQYSAKEFSEISKIQRQRFMRLAKLVSLKKFPCLALLSQNQLLSLCKLSDNKKIGPYLEDAHFDLEFSLEDDEVVADFLTDINEHIKEAANPSPQPKEETESKKKSLHTTEFLGWLDNYKSKKTRMEKAEIANLQKIHDRVGKILKRFSSNKSKKK